MFSFFKARRRRLLAAEPLPTVWREFARQNVDHYRRVSSAQREKLDRIMKVFVAEKHWEGCEGLTVSDEMRVTVAAQAGVMLLGVDDYYFDHVTTVLLYPRTIRRRGRSFPIDAVTPPTTEVLGEAWHEGVVVLSWPAARRDARGHQPGQNVVIHEMAHQLDRIDGEMGGTPPLVHPQLKSRWETVVDAEYQRLCHAVDTGQEDFWDPYAATSRAELFAVASECYFCDPHALAAYHAEFFELLGRIYEVDPRPWYATCP